MVRTAVVRLAYRLGITPSNVRLEICDVLLTPPNPSNWSDYPNVSNEVDDLIEYAPWYRVYEVAEGLYERIARNNPANCEEYEERLNEVFYEHGIGWEMRDGRILARGSQAFEETVQQASKLLQETNRGTAQRELDEAIRDISRRPEADVTGAIQHAMAALECTSRDVTGDGQKTLGQLVRSLDLPQPLDAAVEKLWGFASERGRHIREGREPRFEDAELVVTVASAVCIYLIRQSSTEA